MIGDSGLKKMIVIDSSWNVDDSSQRKRRIFETKDDIRL